MKRLTVRFCTALLVPVMLLGLAGPAAEPAEAASAGSVYASALTNLRNSIPVDGYAGDISRMTLTVDQAQAIISVLQNWSPSPNTYVSDPVPASVCAFLVDAAGTGIPVMDVHYVVSTGPYSDDLLIDEIFIWENGSLVMGKIVVEEYRTVTGFGPNAQGGYSWTSEFHSMFDADGSIIRVVGNAVQVTNYSFVPANGGTDFSINGIHQETVSDDSWQDVSFFNSRLGRYGYPIERIDLFTPAIGVDFSSLTGPLQTFVDASRRPEYSLPVLGDTDPLYQKIAEAVAGLGQMVTVYRLSDSRCFALLENGTDYVTVTVKGAVSGGQEVWTPSEPAEPPADVAPLLEEAEKAETALNITLDMGDMAGMETAEDVAAYIQERLDNVDGLAPSTASKVQLAAFARGWLAAGPGAVVPSGENQLVIIPDTFSSLVDAAKENCSTVQDVFARNGLDIGQTFSSTARVFWTDADPSAPLWVFLDSSLAGTVQDVPLRILLGDASHFLELPAGGIEKLVSQYGELAVCLTPEEDGSWSLMFFSGDESIDRLPVAVTVGLPADSASSNVTAACGGSEDSWGGQYDGNNSVIFFDACRAGRYTVTEGAPAVADADSLHSWSRDAVEFLLSRGWLTMDVDMFRPGEPLTRYEAALALTGMLFALDREQEQTFDDVPADSPCSAAVASAAARDLITGISETEFGGDQSITAEQLFSLIARVLTEYAGFTLPEDPDAVLANFPDGNAVAGWARQQTALAVQAGIISAGGAIGPKDPVTRERAAVMLVRTFNLLKTVPPVQVELPDGSVTVPAGEPKDIPEIPENPASSASGEETSGGMPAWTTAVIAFAAGAVVAGAAVFLIIRRKNGKPDMPDQSDSDSKK